MRMTLDSTTAFESGRVLTDFDRQGPSSVDPEHLLDAVARAGWVLLRDFGFTPGTFCELVRSTGGKIHIDPARAFTVDLAQKVDAGTAAVGLHLENGNTPFLPDLCWFHCSKSARAGSQTTVCDGTKAIEELPPSLRRRFAEERIVYSRRVEETPWKIYVASLLGDGIRPQEVSLDQLRALLPADGSARIEELENGAIRYSCAIPAIRTPIRGGRPSFANSILGPSYNYEQPVVSWESGERLGDDILAILAECTEKATEEIFWEKGDVVVIDNTRVMHGRRAILDPSREIHNALSNLPA